MFAKYVRVWLRLAHMGFLAQLSSRWGSLGWLGGKFVRLAFFLIFISAIFKKVPTVAGYSIVQVAFFFLTFNLVDILAQLFFRGIYMIGRDIREGDMDFYLVQPVNPLFRISSNMIDFLDFVTLIPVLILTLYVLPKAIDQSTFLVFLYRAGLYSLLCVNGVVIAFSIHVLIASLTVRTQQMENSLWLYRDVISLGRFPVDIYSKSIQLFLTVALPVAIMVSFPSKALMGMLSLKQILLAFVVSFALVTLALTLWNKSLRHYCSVSS